MTALFTRLLLRDGQVVFWNLAFFPMLLVLFLSFLSGDDSSVRLTLTAAIVTVSVMANALFSVAIGLAAARERGVYRLYAVSGAPISRVAAGAVAARAFLVGTAALLQLGIASSVFDVRWAGSGFVVAGFVGAGTIAFSAIAFLVAAASTSSRAANRSANLILIPMMALGTAVPAALLPEWWTAARWLLPSAAMNDGLVAAISGADGFGVQSSRMAVLAAWTVPAILLAGYTWPDVIPRPVRRRARQTALSHGFATTESAAIVASMAVLAATAGPHLQEYLETARMTKARGDVRVIAVSLVRLITDVGSVRSAGMHRVAPALLVGDGLAPVGRARETAGWTRELDEREVQRLESHLVDNRAVYPEGRTTGYRWRGPYLERLSPDPWGNRYGANVDVLRAGRPGLTVVLSAGPNGVVDTPFHLERLPARGDDVLALVWASR